MKAEELRIGNWVKWNYEESRGNYEENPDGNACPVEFGYELDDIKNNPNIVKPIPLTEEWLKRFGFEIKKGAWGTSAEIRIGRVRYVLYQNGNVWSISPTDGFKVDFKYIHTVQNHYFALTGQELNQNKEDE